MNHPYLTTESRCEAGTCVLTVAGELDFDSAPLLRSAVGELPLAENDRLIVDLPTLTFCDSSGVSVLVSTHRAADAAGTAVCLVGLAPNVAKLLRITGLDQVFPVHGTADEALAAAL